MTPKQDFDLFIKVCDWLYDHFGPNAEFDDEEEMRVMAQVAAIVLRLA